MPGRSWSRAGVAATMTESPTAVTSLPDTSGSTLWVGDGLAVGVADALAVGVARCPDPVRCRADRGASGAWLARPIAAAWPMPPALAAKENSLAPANTHTTSAPTIPLPRSVAATRRDRLV